ncbi:MAG: hypothetical protein IJD35_05185 [Clostridia bacterium]|nr:hypothetical protein [Clostridia bacterium]
MDEKALNLDGILQSVMQNPEMLKSAMELAGKLSESGSLSSLFSPQEKNSPAEKNSPKEEEEPAETEAEQTVALAPTRSGVRKPNDMWRHRKLLEALSLYVSEDKRDKFELLLKLFDIMELAGYMKR